MKTKNQFLTFNFTDQFHFCKEKNTITVELSDLQDKVDFKDKKFVLSNVNTEQSKSFVLNFVDICENEIVGWEYLAEDNSGLKLLIIND